MANSNNFKCDLWDLFFDFVVSDFLTFCVFSVFGVFSRGFAVYITPSLTFWDEMKKTHIKVR